MPFGQHKAELIENASQFIGLHDAALHELRPDPMQRQHDLLRLDLYWHKAHARLLAGCPDRLCIRGICLVALNERPDFARRDQAHFVPQLRQSASPLMRAAASLHHRERWLADGKPFEQANPLELRPFYAARVVFCSNGRILDRI